VAQRWKLFLALAVAVLANFLYSIFMASDVEVMLTEQLISLMLMVLTMLLIYATVFVSCRSLIQEKELAEENTKVKMHQELLTVELSSYENFLNMAKQSRHDLRHHNGILCEYLASGDVGGALEYLRYYDESLSESGMTQHCKHSVANAVLCLCERKARTEGIPFALNAVIREDLNISPTDLGTMLSNILENALEACQSSKTPAPMISFIADTDDDRLKIELRNSVGVQVEFEQELPLSTKKNGGTGMKSVLRMVEKQNGMLQFAQEKDVFITRIILPL
jgi:sensor histidine kinase regulating citrate/malate metabolism